MEFITHLINIFLHLDKHIFDFVSQYGAWTYLALFVIIFCETGLVILPFLSGDSLLFVTGTVAATGALNLPTSLSLLTIAAISGNMANYSIGRILAPQVLKPSGPKFLKKEYLDRTHKFFERYGGKTIIISRFVPIVRSFAPFLAGVGNMSYHRFTLYNILGALLWTHLFILGGYFFGNIPWVKNHFSLTTIGIIFISILPVIWEFWQQKRSHHKS